MTIPRNAAKKTPPGAAPAPPGGGPRPLDAIETWIFDLDNTLYPLSCSLFGQVEARMADFIMAELDLDHDAADRMRREFFDRHGTTLRGLMLDHDIEPTRFLEYVHEIDLSGIPANPALVAAINRLPGRKLVFTNATQRHAERVMARIGLNGEIEAIQDIVASAYRPKPDPSAYEALTRRHGFAPERALFVEDMARNLEPAAALGMTTAWVKSPLDWARRGADQPYVHYAIDDLADWLAAVEPARR